MKAAQEERKDGRWTDSIAELCIDVQVKFLDLKVNIAEGG